MPVIFDEKSNSFKLSSGNMTYAMAVIEGYLCHLHFGRKITDNDDVRFLAGNSFSLPTVEGNLRDKASAMDCMPFEYPCFNTGDYREHAIEITDKNGAKGCELKYVSHRIYGGKNGLKGLPASFAGVNEAQTLEIDCKDEAAGLEVTLIYTVFERLPVITRSAVIRNVSEDSIQLERAFSASIDMCTSDYDMITLNGSWARECHVSRHRLHIGKQSVDSIKGESSHQHNPFFALCESNADEDRGQAYGFALMYSGNFTAQAEVNQFGRTRAQIGINPPLFSWRLEKGESFTVPEAVLVYSDEGIGGMSRAFHDFFRSHVIRSRYKYKERPVLINNWEATYFDFDKDKLLSIAKQASELGIEMLVMDDGWFGHRDRDNSSLGDWYVYKKKLGDSLKPLVDEVNAMGMKFGIWFEPEMVSPDSDLFRAHPDWALGIPNRSMTMAREQYVLDFSRKEVRDYIYGMMKDILLSANIEYVKWDMNRPLTEVWSAAAESGRQGEVSHRYVLGVYEFMERLVSDFPDLLLENCSGGGGRFDGGMLYYSPQIWTSDDTDAYERITIQAGASLVYPPSAMGAHVSDCPNHVTGRSVDFSTRGHAALAGTFGYELDVTRISQQDRDAIPRQIADYKKYSRLVREGDFYRLGSIFENRDFTAWLFVSKDKSEALLTYIQIHSRPNTQADVLRLCGLDKNKIYEVCGHELSGMALMSCGVPMEKLWGDFKSRLVYICEKRPQTAELWDGYHKDGTLAGIDIVRGGSFPKGLYHAVAEIIVRHTDGSYLVTQRDFCKESHPGEWEIGAGGSVLKGESFYEGAIRELFEETGIRAQRLDKLYTITKTHENGVGALYIGYLCETDINKNSVILQAGETIDYKWICAEEIVSGEYISQRSLEAVRKLTGI